MKDDDTDVAVSQSTAGFCDWLWTLDDISSLYLVRK